MRSLLFVCTANICRSAYAELVTAARSGERFHVTSAGTHGWDEHPVEEHMAAELGRRGIDSAAFRSRRLTPRLIDAADVVLTASAVHRTFVLQERPAAVRRAFTLGQLARALEDVPASLEGEDLLRAARRSQPTADPADDVEDPFGHGAPGAARAADRIDRLLGQVRPRLEAVLT